MSKDLGKSTSYAYYVAEGGTKTPQEYGEMLVNIDTVATRAEEAADSAAESATGALNSKNAAQTAATTATNKANEATTAAQTATNKAAEAQADADAAALDASQALSAASTATTKATEATTAAATATSAATTATTAKDDAVSAKTAAQTAQTGAETAAASVEASAEQIATNAADISQLKSDLTATNAELADVRVGADGTTYESAGAAVRGQISDLKNTLNVIPHTFIDQAIAQKTLVFGNKGTDTTDHNRLSFSTTIYIKHGTQLKAKAGYQFGAYSRKKAVVTAFTTTYTAPVDRWLWIVFKKTDNSDFDSTDLNVMDLLDLNDYSAFYNMGESDSVLTPITNFDWYNVQYGTDTATTMLFKEATNRISTSYYPDIPIYNVNIGDRVKIKLVNSGYKFKYAIAAIDDSADIVPLYPTDWNVYGTNDIDFISSYHGALAVVLARSDDSNISTSESNNISVEIIPKNYDLLKNKKWYGKTATFMGDSITAGVNTSDGYIYYQMLSAECGFIATGMGVGGSCYSVTSDYGTLHDPISTRYANIPDSDLICLFAGTNDYGHDTPLGTIADTTDISFYGALRVVIGGLIAMYPDRRLVVITPLHRYNFGGLVYDTDPNGEGNTLADYVDAIKNVCRLYSVPVIDAFSISGLNPMISEIKQRYITDGLHPNAAGHKLLAERIRAYFEAL